MNYGRFFRLNQNLSKVVDGVAIYDYVELPAYFGLSEENLMSPQYPVSVTITSNSVRFRLHYSVYKIEEEKESIYGYSVEEIKTKNGGSTKGMKMAHMEEVIFELPYKNDATDRLNSTIKELYNTKFPQRIDNENANEGSSSGGRFLEQLIRMRFPAAGETKANKLVKDLYESMQKSLDPLPSFSSLWLMGLIRELDDKVYIDLYDKSDSNGENRDISGFLRKLLLDFMFDLKHSDIFQNSRHYEQMHSGLMSDFYFSALMHKCEYYYYRKLIRRTIEEMGEDLDSNKERITTLYVEELSRAEDLWVKDIMSPLAEEQFDYYYKGKNKYSREFLEKYSFSVWDSWFAEPEEEMKRVCFTMTESVPIRNTINGNGAEDLAKHGDRIHSCNTDLLVEILGLDYDDISESKIKRDILDLRDKNKGLISQWFFKRYDFNDAFHLHVFKHFNLPFLVILVVGLCILFWGDIKCLLPFIFGLGVIACTFKLLRVWYKTGTKEVSKLVQKRHHIIKRRIWLVFLFSAIMEIITLDIFFHDNLLSFVTPLKEKLNCGVTVILLIVLFSFLFVNIGRIKKIINSIGTFIKEMGKSSYERRLNHVISNVHLFLPRLVASITAAWLTMAMGFDLFTSFFDSKPGIPTIVCILLILLLFVMYEVHKINPRSNAWLKLYRSVELVILSYCISLIIGVVVINFIGKSFMERGGYVGEGSFEKEKVLTENSVDKDIRYAYFEEGCDTIKKYGGKWMTESLESPEDMTPDSLTRRLQHIYHCRYVSEEDAYAKISKFPIVEIVNLGPLDVFIMRDFLIMFSVVSMFMGIFIQLIIFGDNKQMTEL